VVRTGLGAEGADYRDTVLHCVPTSTESANLTENCCVGGTGAVFTQEQFSDPCWNFES